MKHDVFKRYCALIYEVSGIKLGEGKEPMLSARIQRRKRALEIADDEEYLKFVMSPGNDEEMIHLIDAVSTNVTYFFREHQHFDFLAEYTKRLLDENQRAMTVWCAAASSGEEPYTIVMTILNSMGYQPLQLRLLATDISTRVLATAKAGKYDGEKLKKVPESLRRRYFRKLPDRTADMYEVSMELRAPITFSRLNLMNTPYPMKGPFDVIFCRNVMIYFENELRLRFLEQAYRLLKPGGALILGSSESLVGFNLPFQPVQPSIYLKT